MGSPELVSWPSKAIMKQASLTSYAINSVGAFVIMVEIRLLCLQNLAIAPGKKMNGYRSND